MDVRGGKVTLLTVSSRRVDWVGAILVTAGLTFIVFILSDGPSAPDGRKTGCRSLRVRISCVVLTPRQTIPVFLLISTSRSIFHACIPIAQFPLT